ncbi:MAG: PrgI family protein [Patescibacteria group bacterium]
MRFQIPQFIEVEDKIFGPLTLKQFIYLAGGAGMSVIAYLFIPSFLLALVVILPICAISGMFAFYRINNKPLIVVLESAFNYLVNPKLYIWRHEQRQIMAAKKDAAVDSDPTSAFIPKLSDSKLKDLSWSLDTKEALNPVTKEGSKSPLQK